MPSPPDRRSSRAAGRKPKASPRQAPPRMSRRKVPNKISKQFISRSYPTVRGSKSTELKTVRRKRIQVSPSHKIHHKSPEKRIERCRGNVMTIYDSDKKKTVAYVRRIRKGCRVLNDDGHSHRLFRSVKR